MKFKPGQSGNPKGRPKGSRNAITKAVLTIALATSRKRSSPRLSSRAWPGKGALARPGRSVQGPAWTAKTSRSPCPSRSSKATPPLTISGIRDSPLSPESCFQPSAASGSQVKSPPSGATSPGSRE